MNLQEDLMLRLLIPGDFQIMVHYMEGPCVFSDTVCVMIDQVPNPVFSAEGTVCQTDTAIIQFEEPLQSSYNVSWDVEGNFSLHRLNDSTYGILWTEPGTFNIDISIVNGGCDPQEFGMSIEVVEPLPEPVILCRSREDQINFEWSAIDCADSYDIYVNGIFELNSTATSFLVDNLVLGDSVTLQVVAISGCICGNSMSEVTCYTQDCPNADFTVPSVICQEDTATISFVNPLDPQYTLNWSIEGNYVLDSTGSVFTIHWSEEGTYLVSLTIDDGNCLSDVFSESVIVQAALPALQLACLFLSGSC